MNSFKLISSNSFRGLRSKKASFLHLIESESPHFISGTESWLNSTVLSSEIFPPEYQVFRSDRTDGYGGVFFACHSSINCSRISLPYTTESVACKIQAEADKTLIVLTVYRPPNRDEVYMQNLCKLIEDLLY